MRKYMVWLVLSASCILHAISLNGQQIFFRFTDGETKSYPISEVRKITFSGTVLNLHLWAGEVESWELESIDNYSFDNSTGLLPQKVAVSGFQLFPNPASGTLQISYQLDHPGSVQLEIYDLEGKLVKNLGKTLMPAGKHVLAWNTQTQKENPTPAGTYICRLTFDGQIFTQRLVLQ